ncbi:uncharacterized protein LOC130294974 [Hyla sarda]|uniref:uncharacterized protein LOC130294974 n=1 Tax=Hyla sarda TaxID=327740 RepID=UPI0024C33632|nr:uncharacterized protein LOC130294974 [Hyla sarda]
MEHQGLLITFMDDGSLETEELSKNIVRKDERPLYIVTNEKSRDYVLQTAAWREAKDMESKENVGKECSSKRKPPTCRVCGSSLPHDDGQKLSKDCLIEDSPDPTHKTWSKKVIDWVEDYVQSSLKETKDPLRETKKTAQHRKSFCYGISTKLFSVLSDFEVSIIHVSEDYMEHLRLFLQETEEVDVLQEICQPAGNFFCSSDRNQREKHLEDLLNIVNNNIKTLCSRLYDPIGSSLCGALVTLVAAELASTHGRAQDFDDEEEDVRRLPKEPVMTHREFEKMVKDFDVKTELKSAIRWTKKTYSLYRNKSLDGWVPVGKTHLQSGRIFCFGLCLKTFSISGYKWQVQLFQNYEDTHTMASSFHFMAFAKHLMMFREWRTKLDILRKAITQRDDVIQEISELAARFFCDRSSRRDIFRNYFQEQIKEKCKNIGNSLEATEGLYVMGVGLVVLGALSALSINTGTIHYGSGIQKDSQHLKKKVVERVC